MLTAKLQSGRIISVMEYDESIHGTAIFCMDSQCRCPLIFVKESEGRTSHFKSSGRGDSKHQPGCAFYQPLDLVESIAKVKEFQQNGVLQELKEITIRLNMNGIDPDRDKTTVEKEKGKKDPNTVKVKNESLTPQSISSVQGAVKLLTEYEPDILSSILVNVGSGRKVPISQLIVDQEQAHEMLWNDEAFTDVGYFIHGKVAKIIKREKVMYVILEETSVPFTIVIFQKHWKDFSYTEKQLVGKNILVYGHLRKNEFMDKQLTEIIIKSDRYIEVFKRKSQSMENSALN